MKEIFTTNGDELQEIQKCYGDDCTIEKIISMHKDDVISGNNQTLQELYNQLLNVSRCVNNERIYNEYYHTEEFQDEKV